MSLYSNEDMDTTSNLLELLEQAMSSQMYRSSDNTGNSRRTTTAFTNQRQQRLPPVYDAIYSLMREYNSNMTTYQDNMASLISTFMNDVRDVRIHRSHNVPQQSVPSRREQFVPTNPTRPTPTPVTPIIRRSSVPFAGFVPSFLQQPLITQQQMDEYTENITYTEANTSCVNTTCPITLEDFQEGDPLILLRGCGHGFRPEAIRQWFRTDTRCPLCRQNVLPESEMQNTDITQILNGVNITNMSNSISSAISEALQQSIPANAGHTTVNNVPVLSIDIPWHMNMTTDISNNETDAANN